MKDNGEVCRLTDISTGKNNFIHKIEFTHKNNTVWFCFNKETGCKEYRFPKRTWCWLISTYVFCLTKAMVEEIMSSGIFLIVSWECCSRVYQLISSKSLLINFLGRFQRLLECWNYLVPQKKVLERRSMVLKARLHSHRYKQSYLVTLCLKSYEILYDTIFRRILTDC